MSLDTILSRQRVDARRAGDLRAARRLSPGRVPRSRQEQRGGAVMKAPAIIGAVEGVTAEMGEAAQARGARERRRAGTGRNVMVRPKHRHGPRRGLADHEEAYLKASANGTLPAHARQIMYAARPHIQATADRDLGARFDQYFTQQLLPEYIEEMRRRLERRL